MDISIGLWDLVRRPALWEFDEKWEERELIYCPTGAYNWSIWIRPYYREL
jgi:hypothetical protein